MPRPRAAPATTAAAADARSTARTTPTAPATRTPTAAPSPALTPIQYHHPIAPSVVPYPVQAARIHGAGSPVAVAQDLIPRPRRFCIDTRRPPAARLLHFAPLRARPADGEPARPHRAQGALEAARQ